MNFYIILFHKTWLKKIDLVKISVRKEATVELGASILATMGPTDNVGKILS